MAKGVNLSLRYTIEVKDKDGKIVHRETRESHSLLKNFASMIRALQWAGIMSKSVTIKDTSGVVRDYPDVQLFDAYLMFLRSSPNVNAFGIVAGKGTTAVTRDDYKLADIIGIGTGVGCLTHDETLVEAVNGTPPESKWNVTRYFINQSGGDVTVKEIGIIAQVRHSAIGEYYNYQIVRDVLLTPITLAHIQSMTVTYTWKVTA